MKTSIIVAMDEKRGIGKNGKLLFKIPEDMKRFKDLTTNHPVIMGRKTFEKDIGKCLPNRSNVIVTRNENYSVEGATVSKSLKEAIDIARKMPGGDEVFVIGGGQIYEQAISLVDKLYITRVDGVYDVDTIFPDYSSFSKKTYEEKGESNGFKYTFLELEK